MSLSDQVQCVRCLGWRDPDEFRRDGHTYPWCRRCRSQYTRKPARR